MNDTEFPKDSDPALDNAECVEDVADDPEQTARLETALRALSRLDREMFLAERLDRMSFATSHSALASASGRSSGIMPARSTACR